MGGRRLVRGLRAWRAAGAALLALVGLVFAGTVSAKTDVPLGSNGRPLLLDYKPAGAPPTFVNFPPPEEEVAQAQAEAAEEEAQRNTPAAQLERLQSRTAYQGATFEEAVAVAQLKQRPVMEAAAWAPLQLREGEELVRYIGSDQAEVDLGHGAGKTRVQSMLPLRTEDDNGDLAPTDLRLEDRGGDFRPRNPLTQLRLPKRLADGIGLPDAGLRVSTPDAAGGDGALVDGKVFWANVAQDTDFLAMVLPAGMETFWQLRSHDSPEQLRMTLELPDGATLRRREASGSGSPLELLKDPDSPARPLEVVKDGKVVATIAAPYTSDSDGRSVPTQMDFEASTVTVSVPHRGRDLAYPLMVDPTFAVTIKHDWTWYDGWYWYTLDPVKYQDEQWMSSDSHWGFPNYLNREDGCFDEPSPCNGWYGPGPYTGRHDNYPVRPGDWSMWLFWAANAGEINLERAELYNKYYYYTTTDQMAVWNARGLVTWDDWVAPDLRKDPGWSYKTFCTPYACDVGTNGKNAIAAIDQVYASKEARTNSLHSYLASGYIFLTDNAPPRNITATYQGPAGWTDSPEIHTAVSAQDTGVGLKHFKVRRADDAVVDEAAIDCRADRHEWCPASLGDPVDMQYSTAALPEGLTTVSAEVIDGWGNSGRSGTWSVRVDRSAPEIDPSGSLWNAQNKIVRGQPYELGVSVTDGKPQGPDGDRRAGVQDVVVKVDGVQKTRVNADSCTASDSCAPEPFTWQFHGAEYAEGKHTISIVARDRLNHTATREFSVTVKHAASASVGPGEVDLQNGSFSLAAGDVSVPSFASSLAVTRAYDSYRPERSKDGIFGPGWTSSVPVDEAGADFAGLAEEPDGTLTLTFANATKIAYAKNGGSYAAPDGFQDLKLATGTAPNTFSLSDPDGNVTTFGARAEDPASPGRYLYAPVEVRQEGAGKTLVSYEPANGVLRPTRALAPVPAGVNCGGDLQPGCRALTFAYAPATTALGAGSDPSQWGDFKDRLARIDLTAYDPASGQMKTDAVARYSYDSLGLLRAAWDPRISPELKTTYDYDGSNRLTAIKAPGQNGWSVAYLDTPLADDPSNTWRVKSVSRATPHGMATTSVRYKVPLSAGNAPYDMSPGAVGAWGQTQAPSIATAIFPPDSVPADSPASYAPAEIHYLDANGRAVNVASPGGRITTSEYDEHDNVVRELTAENRRKVLAGAGSADALATKREFTADGLEMKWELGPRHEIRLPSGQATQARKRTDVAYDEGAPTKTFHLPTTTTVSAQLDDESKVDARVTRQTYDWTLRKETQQITDPDGLNLKRTTVYNSAGLVTEARRPSATSGATAHTTKTIYYTAGGNPDDGQCADKPHWANLPCKTKPGGQPASPGKPPLPETTFTYDRFNQVVTETDSSSAVTRTTTNTYDAAGRKTRSAVESGEGRALPPVDFDYDDATGLPTTTQTTEDGTTRTVSRSYDSVGRVVSYTDADGNVSTTTYDLRGRVVTTDDGKGTQTRGYDATTGDLAQLTDSALGTIAGTYDDDGRLVRQDLPDGVRQLMTYDEAGAARRMRYTRTSPSNASFPATPVLDDFDRPDETPLGGRWSNPAWAASGNGKLVGERAGTDGGNWGWGGSYWNAATFAGDTEVFATSPQDDWTYLYLHWDPVARNGYALDYNGGSNIFRIVRITNGVETTLRTGTPALAAGDSFGLRKRGDTLQAWRKPAGGTWQELGASVDDTTYTSGRIAYEVAHTTTFIDDFGGGGTTVSFPTTPVLDDFNRADENPLAGGWLGPAYTGDANGRLSSNAATSAALGWGGSYWNAATFSGDTEVYATSAQDSHVWLMLHWNPSTRSGYALDYNGPSNGFRLLRVTNANETVLVSGGVSARAGDSFGMSKRGSTLQAWRKPTGGSWQALGPSAADDTYSSGRLAYEVTTNAESVDDFGGGRTADCATDCQYQDDTIANIHGQSTRETSNFAKRDYTYDTAGRLVQAKDTSSNSCRVRDYDYDANSNRRTLTNRPPQANGSCDTTATGGVTTNTYDDADRILTTDDQPYEYDALGRITQVPAAGAGDTPLTATYHADDRVRSLTQGTITKTYGLDPLRRVRIETATNAGTATYHYSDDGDSPSWIAQNAGGRWTRNIPGLDGNLVATYDNQSGPKTEISNLHGDLLAKTTATGLTGINPADEFGNPTHPANRYQWLGAKRRASALPSGVVLMGQRVYNPGTGRFLQVDPVAGGSANDYDYTNQDPINQTDLAGTYPGGMNQVEFLWCLGHGSTCSRVNHYRRVVGRYLRKFYGHQGRRFDGHREAFRHCAWSGLMSMAFGAATAKGITDRHEWRQSGGDTKRDQHNNRTGRNVASWWRGQQGAQRGLVNDCHFRAAVHRQRGLLHHWPP